MTSITFRARKTDPASGFTLLELIGVLVIIASMMAIVAPSLRRFVASRRTSEGASQIVALMQHARDAAVNEADVYRFNLDTNTGEYWLTRQEGVTFVEPESWFGQVFALPPDVTAEWKDDNGNVVTREHVSFYPTGRLEPGHVRLQDRDGNVAFVRCASPTEMFRVEKIDVDRFE